MEIYSEVRNDYMEGNVSGSNVCSISIDAWKTGDDNEEGEVVAKVYGVKVYNEIVVFEDYVRNEARLSNMVKESVEEAIGMMEEHLNEGV